MLTKKMARKADCAVLNCFLRLKNPRRLDHQKLVSSWLFHKVSLAGG